MSAHRTIGFLKEAARQMVRALTWMGGANPSTLDHVPGERSLFLVNGLAVAIIPSLAALGMTIRIESMTDLSWLQAASSGGLVTFIVIFVLDLAIVRTVKHPAPLHNVSSQLTQKVVGPDRIDPSPVLGSWRNGWRRRIFIDVARVGLALSLGLVTSHAVVEWLYSSDIERLKQVQLDAEEELALQELESTFDADYGPWATDQRNDIITKGAAWELRNGTTTADLSAIETDPEVQRLSGVIANTNELLQRLTMELSELEKNLRDEVAKGSASTEPGRGPVAIAIEAQVDAKKAEVTEATTTLSNAEQALSTRRQTLRNQAEADQEQITDEQLEANRADVLRIWDEYETAVADTKAEFDFDPTKIGVGERTQLFFDVVFPAGDGEQEEPAESEALDEAGTIGHFLDRLLGETQLIALGFFLAIIGLDLTPFSLKRLFERQHDTIQMLIDASSVPTAGSLAFISAQANYTSSEGKIVRRLLVETEHNSAGIVNETSRMGHGAPQTNSAGDSHHVVDLADTDDPDNEQVVEQDEIELIGHLAWRVDRLDPIQAPERRNAGLYKAYKPGSRTSPMVLKEAVPEDNPRHVQSVEALAREVEVYTRLNNSSFFPQFLTIGVNQDQIILDYFERRSLDYYLFGRAGRVSKGREAPLLDVTAAEVLAWLRHLLLGLREVWANGYAMIDGHPSNTLVQGAASLPTFVGDPLRAGPKSSGFLKLVDPGSAMALDSPTPVSQIRGRSAYQPPEYLNQTSGGAASTVEPSVAGDLYSYLGGVGYFAITGSDPRKDSGQRVIPPTMLNPDAPDLLAEFVLECLSEDPVDRVYGPAGDAPSDPLVGAKEMADAVDNRLRTLARAMRDHGVLEQTVLRAGLVPLRQSDRVRR